MQGYKSHWRESRGELRTLAIFFGRKQSTWSEAHLVSAGQLLLLPAPQRPSESAASYAGPASLQTISRCHGFRQRAMALGSKLCSACLGNKLCKVWPSSQSLGSVCGAHCTLEILGPFGTFLFTKRTGATAAPILGPSIRPQPHQVDLNAGAGGSDESYTNSWALGWSRDP